MIKLLKRIWDPQELGMAMISYIAIALLSALLCNVFLQNGLNALTGVLTDRKNYYHKHLEMVVQDFQNYVEDNEVAITDYEKIREWNADNWYALMTVFLNDQEYYNSIFTDSGSLPKKIQDEFGNPKHSIAYRQGNALTYSIKFADCEGKISIRAFFEARFHILLFASSMTASACCFVVVFLLLFQRKLRYIGQIERGIRILEAGSLQYRIPEKGSDELYSLARSINQMSDSLSEEIRQKDRMQEEEKDMVTALSHDIRTPLTSVLFYLDLLYKNESRPEELAVYTSKAKNQAYRIKEMIEDLFAYSYITGGRDRLKTEIYDGNELMLQLLEDMRETLKEQSFRTELAYGIDRSFWVEADVWQLKRVFENLRSNIFKYAVREDEVRICASLSGDFFCLTQENPIKEAEIEVESYGIGMKTSRKIIEAHGGSMLYESAAFLFRVTIRLPVLGRQTENMKKN